MIKDNNKLIKNKEQSINNKIYYEDIIYPILDKVWNLFFYYNNKNECINILKKSSTHLYKTLISYNIIPNIKNFCDNIYFDVYNILTCPVINYEICKIKLQNDYNIIKDNIIKTDNSLLYTFYCIFYYIDYFAFDKKLSCYKSFSSINDNSDISDSDSDDM